MAFFQKTFNLKKGILYIGGTLAIAGVSTLLGMPKLDGLIRPPLTPPAWVFGVVWSILYLLMGYATYRIASSSSGDKSGALKVYWLQLVVNALWAPVFFRLEWRLFAFFWLLLLIVLIGRTIMRFSAVDSTAAKLLYPYLAWCAFAAYLNYGVWQLNP